MAQIHVLKAQVSIATGLIAHNEDRGLYVLVTADEAHTIDGVASALKQAGIPFKKSRPSKFKGSKISIPLRNIGSAFKADWAFDE